MHGGVGKGGVLDALERRPALGRTDRIADLGDDRQAHPGEPQRGERRNVPVSRGDDDVRGKALDGARSGVAEAQPVGDAARQASTELDDRKPVGERPRDARLRSRDDRHLPPRRRRPPLGEADGDAFAAAAGKIVKDEDDVGRASGMGRHRRALAVRLR